MREFYSLVNLKNASFLDLIPISLDISAYVCILNRVVIRGAVSHGDLVLFQKCKNDFGLTETVK